MLAWILPYDDKRDRQYGNDEEPPVETVKVKFANCYQLNGGVSNIPVFVDKFFNRLGVSDTYPLMPGIICPASACCFHCVLPEWGSVRGFLGGRMLGEILPFYISKLLECIFIFPLSAMVDIKGNGRILKTNLIDYLENHLSGPDPRYGAGL